MFRSITFLAVGLLLGVLTVACGEVDLMTGLPVAQNTATANPTVALSQEPTNTPKSQPTATVTVRSIPPEAVGECDTTGVEHFLVGDNPSEYSMEAKVFVEALEEVGGSAVVPGTDACFAVRQGWLVMVFETTDGAEIADWVNGLGFSSGSVILEARVFQGGIELCPPKDCD